ncbi:cell wall metabolism sensor histidine kinase WalK, partial [uncultured Muribaculum sp.]
KQLTNNINHELKTPVASILVCLELLRDHPEMLSEEKKRELNDRIFANAQRLNSLLKDVAAITRMDEGEEMIEKAPVDLAELVNDVVTEERLRTSMNITVDMPQLKISGNRQLLESIFRNLIDNAISYSGGSEIVIKADSEGNFTVSDNGCGVPDEHLPHIFERFYRIDKGRSRAAGGTGLGLSIVRNAVGIHGSDISVTNNGGLQFRFRLH